MRASPAQIGLPEIGLLRALQRLDSHLAQAVAAADAGSDTPDDLDEFRGLYLTGEEVALSLDHCPGEPAWNRSRSQESQTALPVFADTVLSAGLRGQPEEAGSDCAWLRPAVMAAAPGYELDDFDANLVLIALAPEIDLRYERVYAFLQDDVTRRRPTAELALSLLCPTYQGRLAGRARLAADAPLIAAGLVRLVADPHQIEPPLLARYLKVDDQLVGFALGQRGVDARLARYARLTSHAAGDSAASPDGHDLVPELVRHAAAAASAGHALRLYFRGRPGTGRASAARELAAALGADLLTVDLDGAVGDGAEVPELVRLALRHARFNGAVPCVTGTDALWSDSVSRAFDATLAEIADYDGVVVLTGSQPWPPASAGPADVVTVEIPMPSWQARRDHWHEAMTGRGLPADQAAVQVLASRFRLSGRQIDAAVATAAATAAVAGGAAAPDLMAAARALTGHELAAVATRLPTRAGWDDLVLPGDVIGQLHELCDRVNAGEVVLGDWGLGARLPFGHGVTALFTGPPGTGKTTGAMIVAGELGLDLYRIDLSRVVSKYIGDTEKNLDRVFTAADDASAVLLFDEADALFGKRSAVRDAHDRYANTEVAYLLQKMEEYGGIAILATNLQENLDDAFARRLAFTIGFPFPDEASRRQIWAGVWTPKTPLADDLDLDLLAKELTMSGGSIRNIGIAAAFLAAASGGVVTMAHVLRAAKRECHKLGRTFPEGLGSRVQ